MVTMPYYITPKNTLKYSLPFYVRRTLGLKPWDEFPGRTTKMIVEAVYWSQNREVYLVGHNERYTQQLIHQAKHYCDKLGLSTQNIKGFNQDTQLTGKRFEKSSRIFVDHNCDKDPTDRFMSMIR